MRRVKAEITYATLQDAKLELLAFEKISLADIKSLWIKNGEHDYDNAYLEQEKLPYNWDDPLYMKMVHRFRNCRRHIAQFFHQIDPNNQSRLLQRHLPECYRRDIQMAIEVVTFMAWLSNMLGRIDVTNLNVELWEATPIAWFFHLPTEEQQTFIDRYNKDEIRAYNEIVMDDLGMSSSEMTTFLQSQLTDLQSINVEDDLEASE